MHIVYETLKELGALGKKTITLFNKQDRVSGESFRDLRADHTLKISARTGEGLEEFKQLLSEILAEGQIYMERLFPYSEAGQIQLIREYGQLLSEEYTEGGIAVKARVPREIYPKVMLKYLLSTIYSTVNKTGTIYGTFYVDAKRRV